MVVNAMPRRALAGALSVLVRRMERLHPQLFDNLAKMPSATLRVAPEDLPYMFDLSLGPPGADLTLADEGAVPDATVAARLEILLEMVEGRLDGDMLFFSREISVTGDTAVFVELRNVLEREEIRLLDDMMSFAGPLQAPAKKATEILEGFVKKVKGEHGA